MQDARRALTVATSNRRRLLRTPTGELVERGVTFKLKPRSREWGDVGGEVWIGGRCVGYMHFYSPDDFGGSANLSESQERSVARLVVKVARQRGVEVDPEFARHAAVR